MKAYHFLKDDMCGGYGNESAWKVGEKRTFKGTPRLCERGYHSSPSWYDALQYAKGSMACIVEVTKPTKQDESKYVSRSRKLIDARNAEKVLRAWACDCAERELKVAEVKDKRSRNAIKELVAAEAAAWAAGAARAAAGAAWAARAAGATRAAGVAAGAARVAEIKWQRQHLDELMNELFNAQ